MRKSIVFFLIVIIAGLFVMSVSAAPLNRYYDQTGNKYWCNVDSDGCWVTGENGEHEYIMFWSEASRTKCMGEGSNAPIGVAYPSSEMPLAAPKAPKPAGKQPAKPNCPDGGELAGICDVMGSAFSDDDLNVTCQHNDCKCTCSFQPKSEGVDMDEVMGNYCDSTAMDAIGGGDKYTPTRNDNVCVWTPKQ